MNSKIISPVNIEERKKLAIRSGDTVRVSQRIKEGVDKEGKDKYRIQAFEGLVIACKHGSEAGATFTVRKVVDGVGVERIYPLYSPMISKVEVIRRAKVRRAKLYYVREKATKEIRRQLRKLLTMKEVAETPDEASASAEVAATPTA